MNQYEARYAAKQASPAAHAIVVRWSSAFQSGKKAREIALDQRQADFFDFARPRASPRKASTLSGPKGTVESLLKPESKEKLAEILKYHVVSGTVMATDVVKRKSADTLVGKTLAIKVVDGEVMTNMSTVAKGSHCLS